MAALMTQAAATPSNSPVLHPHDENQNPAAMLPGTMNALAS